MNVLREPVASTGPDLQRWQLPTAGAKVSHRLRLDQNPQPTISSGVRPGSYQFFHTAAELFGPERLGQEHEVFGAIAHEIRAAGHQEKTRMILLLESQPGKKLQAVAIGQIKIADDQLEWAFGQKGVAGFRQGPRRDRRVGPFAKAVPQQFSHLLVIIHYEDSIH
jgi:hypothetical protein